VLRSNKRSGGEIPRVSIEEQGRHAGLDPASSFNQPVPGACPGPGPGFAGMTLNAYFGIVNVL
jgi:hypothetical protein